MNGYTLFKAEMMSQNPLQKIKAKQIAEAEKAGKANPYLDPKAMRPNGGSAAPNKLRDIKAKQLAENPDMYQSAPVLVGVDMAAGSDESVLSLNVGGNILTGDAILEQLQTAMEVDLARLKTYGTVDEKRAAKVTLLPNYLPFVESYMANGHDTPNSIAVRVMIWLIDTGNIEKGVELGLYLINTGNQVMPAGFASSMQTFLCDYVYDWANAQLKAKQSASPYLDVIITALLVDKWELNGIVASKMYAMAAKHQNLKGDLRACVRYCNLAEQVNPEGEKGAGVKTLKKDTLKTIDKLPPETGVEQYLRDHNK